MLHSDETHLQVINGPGKSAQSKSYMWLYRTSSDAKNSIILYEYQPSRSAMHPDKFLDGWSGFLHADGYSGYHSLEKNGNITVIGCIAHARRKFNDALKGIAEKDLSTSAAYIGKKYCDKLFSIEADIKNLTSENRYNERLKRSRPVMDEFFLWLNAESYSKGLHGNAVNYTLKQWKYLERYLIDGRLEISNNRAERSIKPFVIGRKNWLFSNTPKGAKASAIIYSIVETAKENGLNPYDYLTYIFKQAPNLDLHNSEHLNALMPQYFKNTARA